MIAAVVDLVTANKWTKVGTTGVLIGAFVVMLNYLINTSSADAKATAAALLAHDAKQTQHEEDIAKKLDDHTALMIELVRIGRIECAQHAKTYAEQQGCKGDK